ncbi:MAG: hypothetical protein KJ600_03300 [Nanoarchaeota archaeon]|nr:hypothetical protein [Nanoarchaeota archaeon]MBU1103554.1 hypothetical protein [Nanoarchaeota archaeon]MBU1989059.1 hypothetical protein [Nanoarchaeota archaeon]
MSGDTRYLTVHFSDSNTEKQRRELRRLGGTLGQRKGYKVDFVPPASNAPTEIWVSGRGTKFGFVTSYESCRSLLETELARVIA